ncbi:YajG family lipoprotein [Acidithiobacillus sp.]|uniref:YajG family lipoprotein n=1 Tax=Acidithiobacillus sp. TaxID=1872118 RepID=UPI002636B7C4|nr:YajG family lipoprotein [Acidithiobacillus sp.]MDD2750953.1 YajG family lipoprotein [Acidithiobacillus sp.]MDD5280728.1 YajG family lipoprotein [Acidithiobacillus sp.]
MNTNIKTAAKLAAFAGAFALTGCAFMPASVHPTYTDTYEQKLAGASSVAIKTLVSNDKKNKNEVSYKRDGFGIKMAGVYSNVEKDFIGALNVALRDKGFIIRNNGYQRKIVLVVKHFMADESNGLITQDYTGTSVIGVKVCNNTGKILFSHIFIIKKFPLGRYAIGGAGIASKKLLNTAINDIVSDNRFLHALIQR